MKKRPSSHTGSEYRARRKKSTGDLWGQFGLKKPSYTRYSGLGGVLWYLMSMYVRESEWRKYGVCVDGCGAVITDWHNADCGHLKSASKLATRFQRENLGLQKKWCNSPYGGMGNPVGFAKTVDERYGKGTAERLERESRVATKPFPKSWYLEQIETYKQKLKELELSAGNKPVDNLKS